MVKNSMEDLLRRLIMLEQSLYSSEIIHIGLKPCPECGCCEISHAIGYREIKKSAFRAFFSRLDPVELHGYFCFKCDHKTNDFIHQIDAHRSWQNMER